MTPSTPARMPRNNGNHDLPALEPTIIWRIEQALARVGDFGEIGLVIVKGQIKYIRITSSEGVDEWPNGERQGM